MRISLARKIPGPAPVLALAVAFLASAPGAAGQRRGAAGREALDRHIRWASLELNHRAAEIVDALAPSPGSTVATFGLTRGPFLKRLLQRLGPEGRVIAVCRDESVYQRLRDQQPYGGRMLPIFTAHGDAHLEPDSVDLMVFIDLYGFLHRVHDLLRQGRQALRSDGRLAVLRLPSQEEILAAGGEARAIRRGGSDPARLTVEARGFRWVASSKVLQYRYFDFYRRAGGG